MSLKPHCSFRADRHDALDAQQPKQRGVDRPVWPVSQYLELHRHGLPGGAHEVACGALAGSLEITCAQQSQQKCDKDGALGNIGCRSTTRFTTTSTPMEMVLALRPLPRITHPQSSTAPSSPT